MHCITLSKYLEIEIIDMILLFICVENVSYRSIFPEIALGILNKGLERENNLKELHVETAGHIPSNNFINTPTVTRI